MIELKERKNKLKEKLNPLCENENKRLMIIKYLEKEDKNKRIICLFFKKFFKLIFSLFILYKLIII